tara:strand:- start:2466 stop:3329 length:864 start_codon:yes stop_codon:yes gene_type:complete
MINTDISFYVPVYNGEKTIEKCVNSILKQTLKPSNILIINDCSTDKTLEILKGYGPKITIYNNSENQGVSFCRNLAINKLGTRFIASIDADVELDNNWLETLYSKMQKKKITLIGGRLFEKYVDNPCNYWRSLRIGQQWGDKDIINPSFVFGCNNLLDTNNIDRKNIFNLQGDYFKTNGEDIEFSKYLKEKKQNIYYSSESICYHLQNDDINSLSKRYWRYLYYGDGFKKRNFIKTIKNMLRQLKKTVKWSLQDIFNLRLTLIKVNFGVFFCFCKLDYKHMKNKIYD